MLKFVKILIFIGLLLVPLVLGIMGIKSFYAEEYLSIENKTKITILKKAPFLEDYIFIPKPPAPKKIEVIPLKAEIVELPKDYLTNKEVYEVICESKPPKNLEDKFIGCLRCPKSLNANSPDYFHMQAYALGSVVKKEESEAIFFMKGCFNQSAENGAAFVVRKGFGGWQKVEQFKNITFVAPPLVFKDQHDFLLFVGKKRVQTEKYNKETLVYLTFKNSKPKVKEVFSSHSPSSISCHAQFLSAMDTPEKNEEKKFSLHVDVLGWEEEADRDCPVHKKKWQVHLKPGAYNLAFIQHDDDFEGDKIAQNIVTELEKAQE